MKTSIALALIVAVIFIACDKDKFQTVPQLKLKSRNTELVPKNGALVLDIEFTDKEGDVKDSLIVVRQRLNKRGPVKAAPSAYTIPDFPKLTKGEFEVNLTYQLHLITNFGAIAVTGQPNTFERDTLLIKIVARDKGGNKSDTLVVDNVYVIR